MNPLVEKYKKIFNPDMMSNAGWVQEGHAKAKVRLSKIVPMEDGILRMVVDHLPSPTEG